MTIDTENTESMDSWVSATPRNDWSFSFPKIGFKA